MIRLTRQNLQFSEANFSISDDSSYCNNRSVTHIADLDSGLSRTGVNNLTSAYVHCHVTTVAHQVTRLHVIIGYFLSGTSLLVGSTGQCVSEIFIYSPNETGTIRSIRQACPTQYIRITDKLTGIFCNFLAKVTSGCLINDLTISFVRVCSVNSRINCSSGRSCILSLLLLFLQFL